MKPFLSVPLDLFNHDRLRLDHSATMSEEYESYTEETEENEIEGVQNCRLSWQTHENQLSVTLKQQVQTPRQVRWSQSIGG
jgi:hypothetical protein